jgi:hypothetical protein
MTVESLEITQTLGITQAVRDSGKSRDANAVLATAWLPIGIFR